MELSELTAKELSQMLRKRTCSASEILESVLQQIQEKESDIGAYITLTEDLAKKQAQKVDEKLAKGVELAELAGIPIAVKDVICTKGILTTAGSKILENFVPQYNATVFNKVLAANMVVVGKANLDEFAMGTTCESSALRFTKNPRDLTRVPGGSSGGSAAAVAGNEAILALGSDTGGSVRLPAAFCGVVGLRPTYGRVSRYGVIPLASSFDQVGPMGKTVGDVRMLFNAIAGEDPKDMTTIPNKKFEKSFDIKKLTLGIYKEQFNEHVDPEISASVMKMVESFKEHGATIKEISVPYSEYFLPLYQIILTIEAASNLARHDGIRYGHRTQEFKDVEELYCKTRSEGFGPEPKRRIILGTFLSSAEFGGAYRKKAFYWMQKIAEAYDNAFKECDLLISPMSCSHAFKVGELVDPIKIYALDLCAFGASLASIPALALPCGLDSSNLPIGTQIIGPKYSEKFLFDVGEFYEAHCKT
ncbi:MAG: Asp-tRNA(Asn)/Glu-tRNA(Gln) amidotransferase subunit GatA [Oscillospiraceae bacterium]|nr:Asp-tRNA(Asn)/Glu-tRNA(Gln) amidotransferase subunit GatA [Oscillospiraceae bacterium]